MKKIRKNWSDFKTLITLGLLFIEHVNGSIYELYAQDTLILYSCQVEDVSDKTDYETNFQASKSPFLSPIDQDGKLYLRAESRPLGKTTYFTCRGDGTNSIGDGQILCWDFANNDNDITPSGVSYKKKRLEFSFIDPVNIKEGAIYFQDAPKGCCIELMVVCPNGQYYLDNAGTPTLATADTVIDKFVNSHFLYGNCPMGDELNTEAASSEIPSNYKFWIDIITPDTDAISFGHISIELYRSRTAIL